ncbi:SurA N-terminal domain-containing protein [Nevskia sp.]|uniref:SurA N-terminal domain-containing protein n=1 Tax=Nevskia sp. TaxID=1929292 RepID=UPI0025FEA15D|nr:SurA N-terminal domain-containing protein [Nevskia sp.]
MMQQIRDSLNGPLIVGVLLAIIGVPFAFSGIQGYFQNDANPAIAEVGDTEITQDQLRRAYDQRYRQLQQLLGENFRADQINPQRMRESVLEDMVQDALLRAQAKASGFRAGDGALRDYLTVTPAFQENGKFSTERYKQLLAQNGYTPDSFEAQQRDTLVVEQLRDVVLGSTVVTVDEATLAAKLIKQERDFGYLQFEPAKYLAAVNVTPEQIAARYEEKKAGLQAPERMKLAYVELAQSKLAKSEAPSADILKTLYEAEKTRFASAETRRASHILVNFGADKDAAKKKIDELSAQLKAGADFAELAKTGSDDTGSKDKGGELGLYTRGDGLLSPKFEAALFAMPAAGQVSDPVEAEFGWHLIKLTELVPSRTQAFEEPEVQKALTDLYVNKDLQAKVQEKTQQLEQLAFENESSLDPVAKELGLTVETTDWFTRAGGAGITATPAVIEAAFSQAVLTDGVNSKPIAVDADRLVVVRKAEYEAPRQRELAEVEAMLREELRNEQARAMADADAKTALEAIKAGKTIDEVAAAMGLAVQKQAGSTRDKSGVGLALLKAAFKLPRPVGAAASVGNATIEDGSVAVIALTSVRDGAPKDGNERDTEVSTIRDARAGAEFNAYREALKKSIEVSIKALPAEEPLAP